MSTLRDVKALAKKLGATVEDDRSGHTHECRVTAPHRRFWDCDGIHQLISEANIPWKPDYAELIARMNYGLADCVGECDWCDELEEV